MNGYRENNYKQHRRGYSNNMVTKAYSQSRPVCTNAELYDKLEETQEVLKALLSVSRNEQQREYTFSRNNNNTRQGKVVQVNTTRNEVEGIRVDKIKDKYELDNLYEKTMDNNDGNLGNDGTNN